MMHLSLTRRQYYALCTMVLLSPLLHLVPRKTAAEAGCGGWLSGARAAAAVCGAARGHFAPRPTG